MEEEMEERRGGRWLAAGLAWFGNIFNFAADLYGRARRGKFGGVKVPVPWRGYGLVGRPPAARGDSASCRCFRAVSGDGTDGFRSARRAGPCA